MCLCALSTSVVVRREPENRFSRLLCRGHCHIPCAPCRGCTAGRDFTDALYRLTIIGIGLAIAAGLFWLISHTRLGIRIRAGESDREMIAALGVDISKLYTIVFALGAALAGLAGALVGAIQSVQVGMGEPVLILAFVVIVIGGIGSIKGALVGAILVGLTDTLGGLFLPALFQLFMDNSAAQTTGSALASMLIYILMAVVLVWRPQGLYGARPA